MKRQRWNRCVQCKKIVMPDGDDALFCGERCQRKWVLKKSKIKPLPDPPEVEDDD